MEPTAGPKRRCRITFSDYCTPEDGTKRSSETSVQNYQYTLRKIPEEGRSRMERGRMGIFLTSTYLHKGSAACSWFHLSKLSRSATTPSPPPCQSGTVRNAVPLVGQWLLHTARRTQFSALTTHHYLYTKASTSGTHCGLNCGWQSAVNCNN